MNRPVETICMQCGLCCNGALFADVRRENGDKSPLFSAGPRVAQPCPAFLADSGACAIYDDRPSRCRKFECKQLRAVQNGAKTAEAALRTVREAQRLTGVVENGLSRLGFADAHLPLSRRFEACQRAAKGGRMSRNDLDALADLQLTVHRLNLFLAKEFYAPDG
ncbi:MAG: YkgJ family cysteine cluster protein [Verrucomicrobia bacterium]|nr:YkgJ family cysteine cluster protein [Verrucomicrobiota bacterium]MDE3099736.1 YkgJ family cysteine cluster protein [Verrucomicrobiota bacterium]